MTPRSKATKIKRLEVQALKHISNKDMFRRLKLRVQTLKNTARK